MPFQIIFTKKDVDDESADFTNFHPEYISIDCKTDVFSSNHPDYEEDFDKLFSGGSVEISFEASTQGMPSVKISIPADEAVDFAEKLLLAAKLVAKSR
jgi:hypothetical protein